MKANSAENSLLRIVGKFCQVMQYAQLSWSIGKLAQIRRTYSNNWTKLTKNLQTVCSAVTRSGTRLSTALTQFGAACLEIAKQQPQIYSTNTS